MLPCLKLKQALPPTPRPGPTGARQKVRAVIKPPPTPTSPQQDFQKWKTRKRGGKAKTR